MPEEINRLLTDHVSSLLFCPTRQAVQNLANEGIGEGSSSDQKRDHSSAQPKEDVPTSNLKNSNSFTELPKVAMVGDVMLDAALFYIKYARKPEFDPPDRFILATIHRAENTDNPERLQSIFKGLEKIGSEIPIVLPLHPRTQKKIIDYNLKISNPLIMITDPVGYLEIIYLLQACSTVVTDSGGLQKEAFFFKKPCITLREETEWVELVEHGFNQLSGAEARTIYGAYKNAFASTNNFNIELYGDGKAGDKIVDFLIRDCWPRE
jgi:UDP-GlcNAc3NAcA epimerase